MPRRVSSVSKATAAASCLLLACTTPETEPVIDGDRPPRPLSGAAEEFPEAFGAIRAVMSLPDGRLVVSDPQENCVFLVDFPAGRRQELARVGEGPREFMRAGGLYRAPGGGVWVLDQELRRLLPISPSGTVGEVLGLTTGGAAGWSVRGPDPLRVDSFGHAYAAIRSGGFTAPDAVLIRYYPGVPPDTLARLQRPIVRELEGSGNARIYQEVLFSPEDAWTVSADGRVAVVRAVPYHVEWLAVTGDTLTGPRSDTGRFASARRSRSASLRGREGRAGE